MARALYVSPITFEEDWPLALDHPMTRQAIDKGYQWVRDGEGHAQLTRRVTGRMAITNYDPGSLSNDERRRLHLEADRHPRNYVFVDIRPGYPGGDYPWHGQIKLRSFNAIFGFLARGISDEPEFDVAPDPRSGPAPRNPVRTLAITESNSRPSDVVFAAKLEGQWYSFDGDQEDNEESRQWNHEAFELLNQLYQMTVTDVARVPTLPITISK